MSATKKLSRNQARKIAYAQQADRSSRNEHTLDGPIIGRLVTVTTEPVIKYVPDEESWTGERAVIVGERKVKPYQKIVHDETPAETKQRTAKREPNAQKRRRQIAAWSRCATRLATGEHSPDMNCRCCGCPVSQHQAQRAA